MKKLLAIISFLMFPATVFGATANLVPSTAYLNTPTQFTATLTQENWAMSYFYLLRDPQSQLINGHWNDHLPGAVMTSCSGSPCTTVPSFVSYSAVLPNVINFTYTPTSLGEHYIVFGTQNSGGYFTLNVTVAPTPTVTPPATYQMNTTVQSSVSGLLGSMVSGYFGIIPIALGIVGGLMVTLFLVGKLIGWVRSNLGGFSGGGGSFEDRPIEQSWSQKRFDRAEDFFSQMHTALGISGHNDSSAEIKETYQKYGKQYRRKRSGEWVKK
jgi:hypothetical protein